MTKIELFDNLMKGFRLDGEATTTLNEVTLISGAPRGIIDCPECSSRGGRVAVLNQSIMVNGFIELSHQLIHGLLLPGHSTLDEQLQKELLKLKWKKND